MCAGLLTEKHLQKLEKYFNDVVQAEDRQASRQLAGGRGGKGKVQVGVLRRKASSYGSCAAHAHHVHLSLVICHLSAVCMVPCAWETMFTRLPVCSYNSIVSDAVQNPRPCHSYCY